MSGPAFSLPVCGSASCFPDHLLHLFFYWCLLNPCERCIWGPLGCLFVLCFIVSFFLTVTVVRQECAITCCRLSERSEKVQLPWIPVPGCSQVAVCARRVCLCVLWPCSLEELFQASSVGMAAEEEMLALVRVRRRKKQTGLWGAGASCVATLVHLAAGSHLKCLYLILQCLML